MPVKYVCSRCNSVLYLYDGKRSILYGTVYDKYTGMFTPREVANIYNGKCPICGKELEPPSVNDWNVKVKVSDR